MPLTVSNPANAADINVHGFYALFRIKTTLTAAVATSDTVPVNSAKWFKAGDTILIGGPGVTEEVAILSVSGNTITLSAPTTGTFAEGDAVRLKDFWHLGHVRNPERTQDQTVQEIQSAITGKLQTVKRIVTSTTKGMTFESISGADPRVQALHTGNPSYAGVVSDTTVFVDDVNTVDGEMLFVQPNAETGGIAFVEFKPAAQINGDGYAQGSDGENETALSFEAAFNSDANYTVPAALSADEPAAPLGVIVKTANASLQTVLDAFADVAA